MSTLVITSDMVEHPAGDIALRGLDLYAAGDHVAALQAARDARAASGSAFAAGFIDGLAYACVLDSSLAAAERSVKRFLIALDDPRQIRFKVEVSHPDAS